MSKKLETDLLIKNTSVNKFIPLLTDAAHHLEQGGADFVVLPCNTLHSIIDSTIGHLHKHSITRVGLLGTSITVRQNLFAKTDNTVDFIKPDSSIQKHIDRTLLQFVLTGNQSPLQTMLLTAQKQFEEQNIEDIVVACTDFHGLLQNTPNCSPHDTLSILIHATVKKIVGTRK